MNILSPFQTKTIAIDLGTANTRIFYNEKLVVNEPSVVAIEVVSRQLLASGKCAQAIDAGDYSINIIHPIKGGVIAYLRATELMLTDFLRNINIKPKSVLSPALKVLASIPCESTEAEEQNIRNVLKRVGAKEVRCIYAPTAAALGIGLEILEKDGKMIVDIGCGKCEIAVIALGGIIICKSIKINGEKLDASISEIEEVILKVLEQETPKELVADIRNTGIYLTGGNALFPGLKERISLKTKIPVHISDNPLIDVARGCAIVMKNLVKYDYLVK